MDMIIPFGNLSSWQLLIFLRGQRKPERAQNGTCCFYCIVRHNMAKHGVQACFLVVSQLNLRADSTVCWDPAGHRNRNLNGVRVGRVLFSSRGTAVAMFFHFSKLSFS